MEFVSYDLGENHLLESLSEINTELYYDYNKLFDFNKFYQILLNCLFFTKYIFR